MINYVEIPDQGTVFVAFRDRIVYGKYQKMDSNSFVLEDGTVLNYNVIGQNTDLLELHLFDRNKEYRCVRTRHKGILDSLIDDKTASLDHEDSYTEEIYILEEDADQQEQFRQKVVAVNYIHYSADDLIVIDQYRLKEVE
jgi:hypothetical protein